MATIRKVSDLDVAGKRVFVRVDFNVPQNEKGAVTDDTRIRAALPTIRSLVERGARVILGSHLGRPKGKTPSLTMMPIAERLAELLSPQVAEIKLCDEVIGDGVRKVVSDLRDGEVALLENLRWEPGEEKNDEALSKALASLAEVYVNDAFGTAHRAHCSTAGMVKYFPEGKRGAGFLMLREIEFLSRLTHNVERPFVVVIGGAKVSDKISVLTNLASVANSVLIGGAMANTFLAAQGKNSGSRSWKRTNCKWPRTSSIDALAIRSRSCCRSIWWSLRLWTVRRVMWSMSIRCRPTRWRSILVQPQPGCLQHGFTRAKRYFGMGHSAYSKRSRLRQVPLRLPAHWRSVPVRRWLAVVTRLRRLPKLGSSPR